MDGQNFAKILKDTNAYCFINSRHIETLRRPRGLGVSTVIIRPDIQKFINMLHCQK